LSGPSNSFSFFRNFWKKEPRRAKIKLEDTWVACGQKRKSTLDFRLTGILRNRWGVSTMKIQGRSAIVTGAGNGIGLAVATELAERGVGAVGLVDRNESVIRVARSINDRMEAPVAEALIGDVTDERFRRECFDLMCAKHGAPRVCVPAAGILRDRLAVKIDKETGRATIYPIADFRLVCEVNLIAPVYWAIEMVARIAEERKAMGIGRWEPGEGIQGTVIFIGSISSQGIPGQISYAATKAALEGVAATLSKEAMYHGVRCAVIHPGFTDTQMVQSLGKEYIEKHILPHTQLRRLIEPAEIADAIYFMICNSAVSGEIWADAGWHPRA
jgi:3-oxoacyl-[acyl-carrier protein] reductase